MSNKLEQVVSVLFFIIVFGFYTVLINYSKQEYTPGEYASGLLLSNDGSIAKAFFSPDDKITNLLIDVIAAEKEEILVAIFTLTDQGIAQALVDAQARGVKVELVSDPGYVKPGTYSKIDFLQEHNLPVYIFNAAACKPKGYCLMHNKFALFGKNIKNKALIWTGSFNWTKSANITNQENVVVLDSVDIIESFRKQFKILKQRSKVPCGVAQEEIRDQLSPKQTWWQELIYRFGLA
jgi:cardiolipin hydrolase